MATEVFRTRIPLGNHIIEQILVDGAVTDDVVLTTLESPGYVIVGEYGDATLQHGKNISYTLSGKQITLKSVSGLGSATSVKVCLLVVNL